MMFSENELWNKVKNSPDIERADALSALGDLAWDK
jgi:hypothetical protein